MMTIQSQDVSSTHTKTYDESHLNTPTSAGQPKIIYADFPQAPAQPAPARHTSVKDLVAKFERNPASREAIQEGRQWVADKFYDEEGLTVRSLRLMKGWSQTRLSVEAETSQSHISRIERGSEDVRVQTLRKLASALDVDMNTLNEALLRQEKVLEGSMP